MSKSFVNNSSVLQIAQQPMMAAKDLLAQAMAPAYRVVNGLLVVAVFMVVSLWLSGNGTNAGAFDLARILGSRWSASYRLAEWLRYCRCQ